MEKSLALLVPIDFSPYSLAALDHALAWAARMPGCAIHLAHVVEEHILEDTRSVSGDLARRLDELRRTEDAALARLPDAVRERVRPVEKHLVAGVPAEEIVALASRLDVAAIVMGSHGRTGLTHLVMGSVAERVVRHAGCPVLCVKLGDRVPDPAVGRPIMCAVDFSETSRHAMQVAAELARRLGVELQLVNVYQVPVETSPEAAMAFPRLIEEVRLAAETATAEWVASARAGGWAAVTGTATLGWPPQTITRLARERGCELIVIGTRGRTGLTHVLLGSVAEKVVRTAGCPVLTAHGPAAAAPARSHAA